MAPPRASPLQPGDDFSSFSPSASQPASLPYNLLLTKPEKSDKEAREVIKHLRPTLDADDGQGAYAKLQHPPYPVYGVPLQLQFRQKGGTATRRVVDEAKQPFFFLAWPVRRRIPLSSAKLLVFPFSPSLLCSRFPAESPFISWASLPTSYITQISLCHLRLVIHFSLVRGKVSKHNPAGLPILLIIQKSSLPWRVGSFD